jgi:hypothetical protein
MMTTMTVVAAHGVDDEHLSDVASQMATLGAPTVRAIEIAGVLYAIEGTHRLAAAAQLGVQPAIDVVADGDADDAQIITGLDLDDRSEWTVGDLRDYLGAPIDEDRATYAVEV